ncbi:MAG: hypothetical protein KKH28_06385 [Elusimicrobia bacterium]|nr:hypothetical protein [Elusimicrobiota bacterium]
MKLTPEILTDELTKICGDNLRSVLLYGSAAAGDNVRGSDHNVLVVLNKLEAEDLMSLSDLSARWTKTGNPAPLLFTWERIRQSADVFPMELIDIKENHKILFGSDPLAGINILPENLHYELEHELKGKLIALRERFLITKGAPKQVRELLAASLSTFLVLFKAALRLQGEKPPAKKIEVLALLRGKIEFDSEVFLIVWDLKEGKKRDEEPVDIFKRYLKAVEAVTDAVDGWIHCNEQAAQKGEIK